MGFFSNFILPLSESEKLFSWHNSSLKIRTQRWFYHLIPLVFWIPKKEKSQRLLIASIRLI